MSFVEVKQKKGMLKKEKKISSKQFVRIKRNLLTTEPTKYGLKFSLCLSLPKKKEKWWKQKKILV